MAIQSPMSHHAGAIMNWIKMKNQRILILQFGNKIKNAPVTAAMAPEAPIAGYSDATVWIRLEPMAPNR